MWFCIFVCVESQATMKISLGNQHTQTAQFSCSINLQLRYKRKYFTESFTDFVFSLTYAAPS